MEGTGTSVSAMINHQEGDFQPHSLSSVGRKSNSPFLTRVTTPSHGCREEEEEVPMPVEDKAVATAAACDVASGGSRSETHKKAISWMCTHESASTPKSTLNPEAKEFQLPLNRSGDSFMPLPASAATAAATAGGVMPSTSLFYPNSGASSSMPLFAVPSMSMGWMPGSGVTTDAVFTSSMRADASNWPPIPPLSHASLSQGVGMNATDKTGTIASSGVLTFSGGATSANTPLTLPPMTPRSLSGRIMEDYSVECKSNGFHLVAVFNLEPRTTQEELLNIFFPMGARKAEILPSHRSLRPNRRAGVVFFSSKDFAAVAVEKFNDFVPNRQHQPLTVRYCGPDTSDVSTQETLVQPATPHSFLSSSRQQQRQQQQQQTQPTSAAASSPSMLPWRLTDAAQLNRVHVEMCRFLNYSFSFLPTSSRHVVAIHALDPENAENVLTWNFINKGAERYEMWPVKNVGFATTPMACRSVSALLWYSQEAKAREAEAMFRLRTPVGQAQPIDVVYLNSNYDPSGGSASHRDGGVSTGFGGSVKAHACSGRYNDISNNPSAVAAAAASVTTTTPTNTNTTNIGMMTPENLDAFFLREYDDPKLFLVGVHNLSPNISEKPLFRLFSPHGALDVSMYPDFVNCGGEVRRSGVVFFDTEVAARKAAEKLHNFVVSKQPYPIFARYLVKPSSTEASAGGITTSPMTCRAVLNVLGNAEVSPLLLTVAEELCSPIVDAGQLTEKLMALIIHPDSTESTAAQLASVITNTLAEMMHHAVALSTPLVNALLSLHEQLNIPRKGGKETTVEGTVHDPVLTRNIFFMQTIARALIQLLMDNTKPHESRKVAAVLAGYLFQFSYLMKSPYELAVKLIKSNEISLSVARKYRRGAEMTMKAPALLEFEDEEQKPWITLMQCLDQMTSLWRQNNKSRAKKDPYRKEYERLVEEFSRSYDSHVGGATSLNTSTRPTPRRVVAKVTPGTGSVGNSSPGLTQASLSAPRVSLRGAGDCSGISHDISFESVASHATVPVSFAFDTSVLTSTHSDTGSSYMFVPPQQQQQQVQVQPRNGSSRPFVPEMNSTLESMKPQLLPRTSVAAMQSIYTHAELMERTVYITKLPSTLRQAQFRRLLLHFGEFNKVRMCRDDSQLYAKADAAAVSGLSSGDTPVSLCFSFVEFAEQNSAKAMVEYFRNASSSPQPFGFLLDTTSSWPKCSHFTPQNIQSLLHARTSPARNPIHDQLPIDAVLTCTPQHPRLVLRNRPSLYGIEDGEKSIDTSGGMTYCSPNAAGVFFTTRAGRCKPDMPVTAAAVGGGEGGAEPQQMCAFVPVSNQREKLRGESLEDDDLYFHNIMNTVVPSVPRYSSTADGVSGVLQPNEHYFNPMQVPWLKEMAPTTRDGNLWTGMTFSEDATPTNTAATTNTDGVTLALTEEGPAAVFGPNFTTSCSVESEKTWGSYFPSFGNPLIEDDRDIVGSGDRGSNH